MRVGILGILLVISVVASSPSRATVLTAGSSGLPENFGVIGSGPPPDGTVLAISNGSFSSSSSTGFFTVAVVSDSTNGSCSGCLDFIYQVAVGTAPQGTSGSISRISGFDFAGFLTDVGIALAAPPNLSSTGGITPETIDRSANPGDIVGFNFTDGLLPGTLSDILVVKTNAHSFEGGTLTIDGADIAAYKPVEDDPLPVPEPASMMLLASALIGLVLMENRKLRARSEHPFIPAA